MNPGNLADDAKRLAEILASPLFAQAQAVIPTLAEGLSLLTGMLEGSVKELEQAEQEAAAPAPIRVQKTAASASVEPRDVLAGDALPTPVRPASPRTFPRAAPTAKDDSIWRNDDDGTWESPAPSDSPAPVPAVPPTAAPAAFDCNASITEFDDEPTRAETDASASLSIDDESPPRPDKTIRKQT